MIHPQWIIFGFYNQYLLKGIVRRSQIWYPNLQQHAWPKMQPSSRLIIISFSWYAGDHACIVVAIKSVTSISVTWLPVDWGEYIVPVETLFESDIVTYVDVCNLNGMWITVECNVLNTLQASGARSIITITVSHVSNWVPRLFNQEVKYR